MRRFRLLLVCLALTLTASLPGTTSVSEAQSCSTCIGAREQCRLLCGRCGIRIFVCDHADPCNAYCECGTTCG